MDFYNSTARLLDILLTSERPPLLRPLCAKQGPRSYALLAETLKYAPTLARIIRDTDIVRSEQEVLQKGPKPSAEAMAMLLVHDFFFAKKGIDLPKDHKVRLAIERYASRLKGALMKERIKAKVSTNEGLQISIDQFTGSDSKGKGRENDAANSDPSNLDGKIRWMRVNENKWTTDAAVDWLGSNGWDEKNTLSEVVSQAGTCFAIDEHIPNLLAFPSKSINLPKFAPYLDSRLIAQDKASCMPAYLLLHDFDPSSTAGSPVVIDATSAPGNKTSYASATLKLLGNTGQVYAFERDEKRFKTLQSMLSKADCRNVQAMHADFLQCDPYSEPFDAATHILVDPSCSGSGIHSDYDEYNSHPAELQARLKPLSQFQRHILSAALRFPNARKIVYSTCSIHQEEDEEVVFDMLDTKEFKKKWKLDTRENVLPGWELRGMKEGFEDKKQDILEGMIRCDRKLGTHGFFVAVFVRKDALPPLPVKEIPVTSAASNGSAVAEMEVDAEPKPSNKSLKKEKKQKQKSDMPTEAIPALAIPSIPDSSKSKQEAAKAKPKAATKTTVNGQSEIKKIITTNHDGNTPDFTVLRLATMYRKRRMRRAALRAVRKLSEEQSGHAHGGHGGCGCAH